MLDLNKAFDLINYHLLLEKLQLYDIVQLDEEGVAVKPTCTIHKLYGSLSETEMILEDSEVGMPCGDRHTQSTLTMADL